MVRQLSHFVQTVAAAVVIGNATVSVPVMAQTERTAVVDLHVDLSYQVNYKHRSIESASGQLVARKLVDAGVVGLVLPLYVPHEVSPVGPRLSDIESSYDTMLQLLRVTAPYLPPGRARTPERVMTWFSLEGAAPFAGHPEWVEQWVARGVKIWGLVHVHDNALCTSAGGTAQRLEHETGLTAAGHELVRAIHAAGGIVDVSHASDRTVRDVIEHARQDRVPVVATHSNANHLAAHARNLTDEQLRAIAATHGVIGINFHGKFLAVGRKATLADVVEQIRYLTQLVGIEHVGIGSDFEGGIRPPKGLEDVTGYDHLGRALRRAGFSDVDVRRIMAGNVLRLFGVQP